MPDLTLKKKLDTLARNGVNTFTNELCVFKAKPVSKTAKACAVKTLKEMVN
jgi:hypothetical protein